MWNHSYCNFTSMDPHEISQLFYCVSGIKFETVKFQIGLICCIGSIIFCASPLSSLAEVVRNKSTASLPFPLILLMFLVNACWSIYGHLIDVTFVLLPNLICCVIAGLQLLLFLVYPNENGTGKVTPSLSKGEWCKIRKVLNSQIPQHLISQSCLCDAKLERY